MAIRMLKAWALGGAILGSKEDHRAYWAEVILQYQTGCVPTMDELDSQIVHDWSLVVPD